MSKCYLLPKSDLRTKNLWDFRHKRSVNSVYDEYGFTNLSSEDFKQKAIVRAEPCPAAKAF